MAVLPLWSSASYFTSPGLSFCICKMGWWENSSLRGVLQRFDNPKHIMLKANIYGRITLPQALGSRLSPSQCIWCNNHPRRTRQFLPHVRFVALCQYSLCTIFRNISGPQSIIWNLRGQMWFWVQTSEDFRKVMRYIPCIVSTLQQGLGSTCSQACWYLCSKTYGCPPTKWDKQRPKLAHQFRSNFATQLQQGFE